MTYGLEKLLLSWAEGYDDNKIFLKLDALKVSILPKADPVKEKVQFCHYRLAKGVSGILSCAKEGIRLWFRTKRPSDSSLSYRQPCLKLVV